MNKQDRIRVFNDTIYRIQNTNSLRESITMSTQHTTFYAHMDLPLKEETQLRLLDNIHVTSEPTITAALRLKQQYDRVAILNFASANNPGGGVESGANAQEECICRCSTLYPVLKSGKAENWFYGPHRRFVDNLHNNDILYSPCIKVFKNDQYELLDECESIDVITCAAPNLRDKPSNQYNTEAALPVKRLTNQEQFDLHVSRANQILMVAAKQKVKALVLGAFGCGAFRNNPYIVACAFKAALMTWASKFESIDFAIFCREGETENYDAFKKVFNSDGFEWRAFVK